VLVWLFELATEFIGRAYDELLPDLTSPEWLRGHGEMLYLSLQRRFSQAEALL
jgi:hypothetical protein